MRDEKLLAEIRDFEKERAALAQMPADQAARALPGLRQKYQNAIRYYESIRAEFDDEQAFMAYCRALGAGRIKHHAPGLEGE